MPACRTSCWRRWRWRWCAGGRRAGRRARRWEPLAGVVAVSAGAGDAAAGARLGAAWAWAPALIPEAAVRALVADWAAALTDLAAEVAAGAGGRTPSDVPLVALTQAE